MTPKIGDIVYVPSSAHISGGKIKIQHVHEDVSAMALVNFVGVGNLSWNWEHYLEPNQDKWAIEFGGAWACTTILEGTAYASY